MTDHLMEVTDCTDDYVEFTCEICQRVYRISYERGLQVVKRGDQSVTHSGATSGLKLAADAAPETRH